MIKENIFEGYHFKIRQWMKGTTVDNVSSYQQYIQIIEINIYTLQKNAIVFPQY
jgi:hypothetical protein